MITAVLQEYITMRPGNKIYPEDIDNYLKDSLLAYLNGEVTEEHLARMLKQQLHGYSTKLSFRVVDLLPQFNQLLELLKHKNTSHSTYQKIISPLLKELSN